MNKQSFDSHDFEKKTYTTPYDDSVEGNCESSWYLLGYTSQHTSQTCARDIHPTLSYQNEILTGCKSSPSS